MNQIQKLLRALPPKLLIALACLGAAGVSAQWQWMDKDGRKVYSDRPPPADVLEKNILKRPGGRAAPAADKAAADKAATDPGTPADGKPATAAGSGTQAAANTPKLSSVDKDLEQKKKAAADAEAAKRKAEEEKVAKANAENCARAKQAKATLESGVRLGRTNAKGEREVMDDAAKAEESKRAQSVIDSSCK